MDHTSEFSRIAQSPPAMDLSGGMVSEDSFTVRRNSPAVADAVDFQLDSFLSTAILGSTSWLGRGTSGSLSALMVEVPA